MTETRIYDVVVLGGGTAGSAAAKAAQDAGARTVMFNDGELGGLCILRGCMPTKTMLHTAHLLHHARAHKTPGVGRAELAVDFKEVMANKDRKVERFQNAKIRGITVGGYEVVDARARFAGPDTVEAGGVLYRFTRGAVIATGSVTHVPPIPGLDEVPFLTSDDVMRLEHLPESVTVIGSGAIGLEFAQFFARLGSRVDLVSRRPIFCDIDPEICEEMDKVLHDEPNLRAHHPVAPTRVRRADDGAGVIIDLANGEEIRTEALLLATGRRPAVDDLNLEAAGVRVLERGALATGPDMRTTAPHVFVAGDASGDRLLLHVANWEGRVAGLLAAGVPGDHRVEQRMHMEVVFCDPPLASVGMTENQAKQAGLEVVTASVRFPETGRSITMDVEHGAAKLVARKDTGELLGAQLFGPRADDVIHILGAVMAFHGTAADMLQMPWYHPTISEVLLSLARDLDALVRGSAGAGAVAVE
jgi:pyruvate/2-oxoglutarate dehydrogenase complex dihydrolipoamide dehydrogenase (E3) component